MRSTVATALSRATAQSAARSADAAAVTMHCILREGHRCYRSMSRRAITARFSVRCVRRACERLAPPSPHLSVSWHRLHTKQMLLRSPSLATQPSSQVSFYQCVLRGPHPVPAAGSVQRLLQQRANACLAASAPHLHFVTSALARTLAALALHQVPKGAQCRPDRG